MSLGVLRCSQVSYVTYLGPIGTHWSQNDNFQSPIGSTKMHFPIRKHPSNHAPQIFGACGAEKIGALSGGNQNRAVDISPESRFRGSRNPAKGIGILMDCVQQGFRRRRRRRRCSRGTRPPALLRSRNPLGRITGSSGYSGFGFLVPQPSDD